MATTAVRPSGTLDGLLTVLRTYREILDEQCAKVEDLARPGSGTDPGERHRERSELWRLYHEIRRYYERMDDALKQARWAETDEVMLELRALGSATYRARDAALEAGLLI